MGYDDPQFGPDYERNDPAAVHEASIVLALYFSGGAPCRRSTLLRLTAACGFPTAVGHWAIHTHLKLGRFAIVEAAETTDGLAEIGVKGTRPASQQALAEAVYGPCFGGTHKIGAYLSETDRDEVASVREKYAAAINVFRTAGKPQVVLGLLSDCYSEYRTAACREAEWAHAGERLFDLLEESFTVLILTDVHEDHTKRLEHWKRAVATCVVLDGHLGLRPPGAGARPGLAELLRALLGILGKDDSMRPLCSALVGGLAKKDAGALKYPAAGADAKGRIAPDTWPTRGLLLILRPSSILRLRNRLPAFAEQFVCTIWFTMKDLQIVAGYSAYVQKEMDILGWEDYTAALRAVSPEMADDLEQRPDSIDGSHERERSEPTFMIVPQAGSRKKKRYAILWNDERVLEGNWIGLGYIAMLYENLNVDLSWEEILGEERSKKFYQATAEIDAIKEAAGRVAEIRSILDRVEDRPDHDELVKEKEKLDKYLEDAKRNADRKLHKRLNAIYSAIGYVIEKIPVNAPARSYLVRAIKWLNNEIVFLSVPLMKSVEGEQIPHTTGPERAGRSRKRR